MIVDSLRHVELLVFRPAIVSFGKPDLFFAEGFAVGAARVLLVRRAISDMAVHDNQRRAILRALKVPESTGQHVEIVCITHSRDVPAVTDKTSSHIFGEG